MSQPDSYTTQKARRAPEAVALYNAVFTSQLLVNAAWSKFQANGTGISWPTAFLILPLTLHPPTRAAMPRDRRITLARWAVRNPELVVDMDLRVANMGAPTRRAIRHGMRSGWLGLDGTDLVALRRPKTPVADWPPELRDAVKVARVCGVWLAGVDNGLAFEMLGIEG